MNGRIEGERDGFNQSTFCCQLSLAAFVDGQGLTVDSSKLDETSGSSDSLGLLLVDWLVVVREGFLLPSDRDKSP